MAVAIDGGLMTPTIVKAQDQDLFSIGRNWKVLVDKAKNKKLSPAEYSSGEDLELYYNFLILEGLEPFVSVCVCLSVCVFLSVFLCQFVCMCVCLTASLSAFLSICLSHLWTAALKKEVIK